MSLAESLSVHGERVGGITNVSVVDVAGKRLLPDATVLVSSGRVDRVVSPASALDVSEWKGHRVVDGQGMTLLPGLIDMHVHAESPHLPLFLAFGVTTVRDLGNDLHDIRSLAQRSQVSGACTPRIYYAGQFVDGPTPMWPHLSASLTHLDEVESNITGLNRAGASVIKAYMDVAPSLMSHIIQVAHSLNMPVTAHLGKVTALQAAELGIDGIEHAAQGLFSALSGARPPDTKAREKGGQADFWKEVVKVWAAVSLDDARVYRLLQILSRKPVVLDPTLSVIERVLLGDLEASTSNDADAILPDSVLRHCQATARWFTNGWTAGDYETAYEATRRIREVVGEAHQLGCLIVAGSDAPFSGLVPGQSLQFEMASLAGCGMAPIDVLRAATVNAAAALHIEDIVGSIEPGARADLALYRADPSADIGNLRSIKEVYRDGVRYHCNRLLPDAGKSGEESGWQIDKWVPAPLQSG